MGHAEAIATPFAITNTPLGGTTKIAVSGELDLATAPQLDAEIRQVRQGCSRLVLDLTDLTFIDSIGISVILDAKKGCEGQPFELYVIPAKDDLVTKVFAVTGMEKALI